jgi:DNA-binding SARP family transcriptional activator
VTADFVDFLVARRADAGAPVLRLFGDPRVTRGDGRLDVHERGKGLLAFVAMHGVRVGRRFAAGALRPSSDEARAARSLRSALWRLNRVDVQLVIVDSQSVALPDGMVVDADLVQAWATRVINWQPTAEDLRVMSGSRSLEILAGWYDDWVLTERKRVRQQMLHTLDTLSRQLIQAGRTAEAVEVATVATGSDPLRESGQHALLEANLAEGDWAEGHRAFTKYRKLLRHQLAVEPDPLLWTLLSRAAHRARRDLDSVPGRLAPVSARRIEG